MKFFSAYRIKELLAGWRHRVGPLWWYSGLIFIASRVGDLISLFIGVIYLPSKLSPGDLGSIEPITRFVALGAIPLSVLSIVGTKYLSAYQARGEFGKIKQLLRDMALIALGSSVVSVLLYSVTFEGVCERLHLSGPHIYVGMIGMAVVACWQPILSVMLQGTQRYYASMAGGLSGTACRLILALLLVPVFLLAGYLWALLLSGVVAVVVGAFGLRVFLKKSIQRQPYYAEWQGMFAYAIPVLLWSATCSITSALEPFVIRHWLSAMDAGGYYMACRFGYIPAYLVGAVGYVLFPLLSHRHERGESTTGHLYQSLLVTVIVSGAGVVLIGSAARVIFNLRPEWQQYLAYAPQVWKIGLMVTLEALSAFYTTHEFACRRFGFLWIMIPLGLLEGVVLYGSFGWGAFQPYLPECLWTAVQGWVPLTLNYAIGVMLCFRIALIASLVFHWCTVKRKSQ